MSRPLQRASQRPQSAPVVTLQQIQPTSSRKFPSVLTSRSPPSLPPCIQTGDGKRLRGSGGLLSACVMAINRRERGGDLQTCLPATVAMATHKCSRSSPSRGGGGDVTQVQEGVRKVLRELLPGKFLIGAEIFFSAIFFVCLCVTAAVIGMPFYVLLWFPQKDEDLSNSIFIGRDLTMYPRHEWMHTFSASLLVHK